MSTGDNKLKVAIVGAGPGGLAATILLQRLPFVELIVYEQATELREVGAVSVMTHRRLRGLIWQQGISINQNTWRLLKLLGAADFLEEFRKRGDERTIDTEHRWTSTMLHL
jgi:salicylate hydroxylase